jgi:hypothetical protein
MDGRAGLTLEAVWMLRRHVETFPSQKLIDDCLVIQPTALPSGQAGSCPKKHRSFPHYTENEYWVFQQHEPHKSQKQGHTLCKVMLIFSVYL